MQLLYNSETIQVHIQRSKRKTLCLSVNKDGSVTVKAPHRIPADSEIAKIVEQKAGWILKQRQRQQEREEQKIPRRFETGSTFPYLGEERLVEMQEAKKISITYKDGTIVIKTPEYAAIQTASNEQEKAAIQKVSNEQEKGTIQKVSNKQEKTAIQTVSDGHELTEHIDKLRKELKKWYKKQAKEYITKRVEYYQNIIGVSVTSVSIKSRKSQWGSCDSNGNLTFSWRLVMACPEAIDYVVVHELCHRRHMNHSKQFWQEVKRCMPDYETRKKWLEDNSINLNIE